MIVNLWLKIEFVIGNTSKKDQNYRFLQGLIPMFWTYGDVCPGLDPSPAYFLQCVQWIKTSQNESCRPFNPCFMRLSPKSLPISLSQCVFYRYSFGGHQMLRLP